MIAAFFTAWTPEGIGYPVRIPFKLISTSSMPVDGARRQRRRSWSNVYSQLGRKQEMNPEPRSEGDYSPRQVEAAHRVLVDVGQVLGSFLDCMVVVGGWVPDLLVPEAERKHIGSIDVDLALDAEKLKDG